MANWLRFVFSWLARRRQRKAEQAKAPLRRRASFPVYKPLSSGSVTPNSTNPNNNPNLAFNSVRAHHTRTISANAPPATQSAPIQQIHQQMQQQPSAGGLYVPPGYVYKTSETRVGNRRVTVSAGAYPGHFAPQPGAPNNFVPSHSRTASAPQSTAYQVYANAPPASRTVAAGTVNGKQAPPQTLAPPQSQYYYDPRSSTTPNPVMTQVTSTTPVTIAQTSTTAPTPRTSKASTSTTRRQAPAPPSSTSRRKSSRTPLSSQPPQEQVRPSSTSVTPARNGGATLAPPQPTAATTTATTSSKRVSTARRSMAPATVSQPYNASRGKVVDAYNRYAAFWQGAYSPRTLTFSAIPWPVVDAPKHPTSLNVNAVRSFLLSPHHSQGVPARERVEHAQSIWEPKSFMATWGPKMREEDKEKIERTLLFLQGTLRILYNEVVAAESLDDGSA